MFMLFREIILNMKTFPLNFIEKIIMRLKQGNLRLSMF